MNIEAVAGQKELATALAKAQGELDGAKKGKKNDHFRSKYADLAAIWDACREALSDNGLSVVQIPCEAPPGSVGLTTILMHQSGQCIGDKFFMPIKDPTNPQAVGSALTYARRYALAAMVGVCPEDDDGNAAASSPKATLAAVPGPTSGRSGPTVASAGPGKKEYQDRFAYELGSDNAVGLKVDNLKSVYTDLRNSTVSEPDKTQLLTEWGKVITNLKNTIANGATK